MSNSFKDKICRNLCNAVILVVSSCIALAAENDDIQNWFVLPGLVWGKADTNNIRAGVYPHGLPNATSVTVYVTAKGTNANWSYLAPPGFKFSKMELRDAHGVIITPLQGKNLYGNLAQHIALKDLPRLPKSGTDERGSGGGLRDWLVGRPAILQDFSLQRSYRIEKEGDYKLSICAAIYGFSPDYETVKRSPSDEQFVTRVDLPCVTVKIHLAPSGLNGSGL
jgi:hypothetical protein